jgi:hypothetical protein
MEIFDVHRKDVHTFDDYMDLKKPGFGGPNSAKLLKDNKGKYVNPDRKLKEYQRTVERHDSNNLFNNQVYDPTYKAMGGDRSTHVDGKNPYEYKDSYDEMGLPVVIVGKKKYQPTNEGFCNTDFNSFVLESDNLDKDCDCDCEDDCDCYKNKP